MKSKRILLTGGSGFIGRNLVEFAGWGSHEIFAPRHSELELGDEVAVRKYLRDFRIDVVIHSAVKPGHRKATDTSQLLLSNLRMFFNLARNSDVWERMVIVGSGAIYDNRFYGPKRIEDSYREHVPIDEHGFAKYAIEQYLEGVDRIYDLRVFGVYGKYEDYQIRFVSNMICKALAGLPLTVKQDRRFDYLWVEDLAPILLACVDSSPLFRSTNVTPDRSESLVAIAQIVQQVVGRQDLPIVVAQPGMGLEYSGDNSRLREWLPQLELTAIRKGIETLTAWYKDHWAEIDVKKLEVDP